MYESGDFDKMSMRQKRRKLLEECDNLCSKCNVNEWQGEKLTLEIDHIDGNNKNHKKENLRMLCPNCHSLTPTFRNRKRI